METSKSATPSEQFHVLEASFWSCFPLFVRASHALARGAFLSPFNQNDLSLIPDCQSAPIVAFLRSVLSQESAPAAAYSPPGVLRRFPPWFVPGLCSVAPQQVALGQQWKHSWTAVGARRSRKEAAQPGNSGVPRRGEPWDPTAMRFYARLNSAQPPDLKAHFLLFYFLSFFFR